jgi:hypothetical protein
MPKEPEYPLGPEDPCPDCGIILKYHLFDERDNSHYDCVYAANKVSEEIDEGVSG